MPNHDIRIDGQLPAHFREQYPAFIAFMKGYYRWLHRTDNVCPDELEALKEDPSWQSVDIDGFIRTGDQALAGQNPLLDKMQERPPGTELDLLADDYTMERRFEDFETADGDDFQDEAGRSMESTRLNEKHIDEWFTSFDFVKTTDNLIENYGRLLDSTYVPFITHDYKNVVLARTGSGQRYRTLDNIRLLKVLKHIYAIRGTEKAAQLFFSIFFGEPVETFNPKESIMIADESMVLDGANSLRDDEFYNEFSYVILTNRDPAVYDFYFRTIFLKHFHPAGFKVYMQKRQVT
uniref:Baseplate wedge subunit n=1 Tax=Pseudomonas phage Cygsa01 TaxID=3138529 RepID=A0AAU6W321_9VIRU